MVTGLTLGTIAAGIGAVSLGNQLFGGGSAASGSGSVGGGNGLLTQGYPQQSSTAITSQATPQLQDSTAAPTYDPAASMQKWMQLFNGNGTAATPGGSGNTAKESDS